jgi:hypothetical protein
MSDTDTAPRTQHDGPMTDAQHSELLALCKQTGQPFDGTLSRGDAARRIDELRALTPSDDESRATAAVETIVSR